MKQISIRPPGKQREESTGKHPNKIEKPSAARGEAQIQENIAPTTNRGEHGNGIDEPAQQ
jgi:hypothetical protein